MNTMVWKVDKFVDNIENNPHVVDAAKLLQENEVVALPTETVYGLGGNAESDVAVEKIFAAKGRPSDNPLIIHIAEKQQLEQFVAEIPKKAEKLMAAFWPGPLTIIFKKKDGILSEKATAGLATVGVRMPDHPVALALLKKCGLPIAAPSANSSGKPSPTNAEHVIEDLEGKIAGVLDGGATGVGVESTVLDCTEEIPVILRPGGVTKEQLEAVIGDVAVDPALKLGLGLAEVDVDPAWKPGNDLAQIGVDSDTNMLKPKAPGMKYTHYAPNAPLYIVAGSREFLQHLVDKNNQNGLRVGVLTTEENTAAYHDATVIACGKRAELESVATALYDTLRAFNHEEVDVIFSEAFPSSGVGYAIMNRLQKAAGNKWMKE